MIKFIQCSQFWTNLNQLDQIWSNLIQFDPNWSNLIQIDLTWSKLIQTDPAWSNLIQIDPNWSSLIHIMTKLYKCLNRSNNNIIAPKLHQSCMKLHLNWFYDINHFEKRPINKYLRKLRSSEKELTTNTDT